MQFIVGGKTYESKFNFYSLEFANDRLAKETGDDVTNIYNGMLMYNKFDSLIQALECIYSPKKNGGLTKDKIIQGLDELEDNGISIDELIEDIINEMESSGFFVRTLKKSNRLIEASLKQMEKMKLDTVEKIEVQEYQLQLDRARERGLI